MGEGFAGDLPGQVRETAANHGMGHLAEIDFHQTSRHNGITRGGTGETDKAANFFEAASAIELHSRGVLLDDFQGSSFGRHGLLLQPAIA